MSLSIVGLDDSMTETNLRIESSVILQKYATDNPSMWTLNGSVCDWAVTCRWYSACYFLSGQFISADHQFSSNPDDFTGIECQHASEKEEWNQHPSENYSSPTIVPIKEEKEFDVPLIDGLSSAKGWARLTDLVKISGSAYPLILYP